MKTTLLILGIFSLQIILAQDIQKWDNPFDMSLMLRNKMRESSYFMDHKIKKRFIYKVNCYGRGSDRHLEDTTRVTIEEFDTNGLLISQIFYEYSSNPDEKVKMMYKYDEKDMLRQVVLESQAIPKLTTIVTADLLFDTDSIISDLTYHWYIKRDSKDTTFSIRNTIRKDGKNYLIYTDDPSKEKPGPDTARLDFYGQKTFYADGFGYKRTTWERTKETFKGGNIITTVKKNQDLTTEKNGKTRIAIDSTIIINYPPGPYEKTFFEGSFYHDSYTKRSALYQYSKAGLTTAIAYTNWSDKCVELELYKYTYYQR